MKKEGRKKNERRKKSSTHKREISKKTKSKPKRKQKKENILVKKQITETYPELEKLFQQLHHTAIQQKDKKTLKKLEGYKQIISKKIIGYHKDPSKIKELTKEISTGLKFLNVINLHLKAEHSKTINAERKKHEIEEEEEKEEVKNKLQKKVEEKQKIPINEKKEEKQKKEETKAERKPEENQKIPINEKKVEEKSKLQKKKEEVKHKKSEGKLLEKYEIEVDGAKVEVQIRKEELGVVYNLHIPEISIATSTLLNDIRNDLISITQISMKELIDPKSFSKTKEKFIQDAIKLIRKRLPNIQKETESFLVGNLIQEMLGLGKIEFLINDPNLEEIVINSSKEPIRIYSKKYGWLLTNITIEKEEDIINYSNIIARRVGRQINVLSPLLDAHLVSGDRVNAVLYPINTKGSTITIRKFARDPYTIIDLINNRTCDLDTASLLWLAIEYEMNILISGGTASGKTVFLNACMVFIPPSHRIISIEDTRELMLPDFLYWTPLVVRTPNPEGKGEVDMLDLLINSLRMRPDRIILGEMRKHDAAMVLFEAMHTGHSVYATLHADSAAETISRLINPPLNVPPNLLKAINLNVVMFRDRKRGIRRIAHIAEVEAGRDDAKANILYRWSPEEDKIVKHSESSRFFEDISRNTGMSNTEIKQELTEKKKILSWLIKNRIRNLQDFGKVMNFYYKNKEVLLRAINKNDTKLILGI